MPRYTTEEHKEVVILYKAGLSTHKISAKLGISVRTIGRWLHKAGVMRDGNKPGVYTKFTNSSTTHRQARQIWIKVNGNIPKDYVIHHIDEDYTNNKLSNLRCMPRGEHSKLHNSGLEYDTPYWKRPSAVARRTAYHKEYYKRPEAIALTKIRNKEFYEKNKNNPTYIARKKANSKANYERKKALASVC